MTINPLPPHLFLQMVDNCDLINHPSHNPLSPNTDLSPKKTLGTDPSAKITPSTALFK